MLRSCKSSSTSAEWMRSVCLRSAVEECLRSQRRGVRPAPRCPSGRRRRARWPWRRFFRLPISERGPCALPLTISDFRFPREAPAEEGGVRENIWRCKDEVILKRFAKMIEASMDEISNRDRLPDFRFPISESEGPLRESNSER